MCVCVCKPITRRKHTSQMGTTPNPVHDGNPQLILQLHSDVVVSGFEGGGSIQGAFCMLLIGDPCQDLG